MFVNEDPEIPLRQECIRCGHSYGIHTYGIDGPCSAEGRTERCSCPHFHQLIYIFPQLPDADWVYESLRKKDP